MKAKKKTLLREFKRRKMRITGLKKFAKLLRWMKKLRN